MAHISGRRPGLHPAFLTKASLVGGIAVVTMAGCTTARRQAPPPPSLTERATQPQAEASVPAVRHDRWRPRHKGGADLASGIYTREDDDLVINTTMPLVLRRTYNSGDAFSRQFGLDWTHPGEWWLRGDSDSRAPWCELILATGARIRFNRISPGETHQDAVLRYHGPAAEFDGALIRWNGSGWSMQFGDGSVARFLPCPGHTKQVCWLIERRDPDGHQIAYVRDASGTLLRMESEGQQIAFDYDDHKRIVRAYDSLQREVRYAYDDRDRLVRAASSDGITREYAYDEHDRLVGVREPGRIVRNRFDESGHWVGQIVKNSEQDDDDPYVATARYVVENGLIVQSEFDEGNGLELTGYNEHRSIVSETLEADGPAPVVFAYDRDASDTVTSVTMSCLGPSGPITRRVPLLSPKDDATKEDMARAYCAQWR